MGVLKVFAAFAGGILFGGVMIAAGIFLAAPIFYFLRTWTAWWLQ